MGWEYFSVGDDDYERVWVDENAGEDPPDDYYDYAACSVVQNEPCPCTLCQLLPTPADLKRLTAGLPVGGYSSEPPF